MRTRGTKLYKNMSLYLATSMVEGFDGKPSHTDRELITAWQWLYDMDAQYSLQGWYVRTIQSMLDQGMIIRKK